MKNRCIITLLAGSLSLLGACGGDRVPRPGDSVAKDNRYPGSKDTSKVDTSKITSSDHSASGGSDLVKDTSKRQKPKK